MDHEGPISWLTWFVGKVCIMNLLAAAISFTDTAMSATAKYGFKNGRTDSQPSIPARMA